MLSKKLENYLVNAGDSFAVFLFALLLPSAVVKFPAKDVFQKFGSHFSAKLTTQTECGKCMPCQICSE